MKLTYCDECGSESKDGLCTVGHERQRTPGPWIFNTTWKLIEGKNGEEIATLHMIQDARLIAAAPELLEACESARNVLAALVTGDLKEVKADSPALQMLRNAVAKAEGK